MFYFILFLYFLYKVLKYAEGEGEGEGEPVKTPPRRPIFCDILGRSRIWALLAVSERRNRPNPGSPKKGIFSGFFGFFCNFFIFYLFYIKSFINS